MRRCVIVLCILAALTVPVLAMDVLEEERQILNVDTLTDGLPDDTQDALRAYSPPAATPAGMVGIGGACSIPNPPAPRPAKPAEEAEDGPRERSCAWP